MNLEALVPALQQPPFQRLASRFHSHLTLHGTPTEAVLCGLSCKLTIVDLERGGAASAT